MDLSALQGLGPHANPSTHARAVEYFERLKVEDSGWQLCINSLTNSSLNDDHVKFFCFQVLEHFVKTRYAQSDSVQQLYLRDFLSQWIHLQRLSGTQTKGFLRNKVAQIFALVFLVDYPHRWPTFFSDILGTLTLGPSAIDLYLRILLAIDLEIVDREVSHSAQSSIATFQEAERNTLIKDTMRDRCVVDLVNSWYQIITTYEANVELTCQCLEVIGSYVSWIDINLIANERFVAVLVRHLSVAHLRESACDCIHEIVSKGMDPVAKTKLVESFISVLDSAGVLNVPDDEEVDFMVKLAKLVNGIGSTLILSWHRLVKAGDENSARVTLVAIENKIPLMLRFLAHEYDDVSLAVVDMAKDYIQLLKQMTVRHENQRKHIEAMLYIVMKKYQYDETYNFDNECEDEAIFLDYRKQLKIVFDNLAQLDRELVLGRVREFVTSTLERWQENAFQDIEAAVTFLYLLGEAIPASQGNYFTGDEAKVSAMQQMMRLLISSGVSCHAHLAVALQFFETVTRYEKFFNCEPQHIPEVLMAFLDVRGLKHLDSKVRSRTAYLFSRFIKCLKAHMHPYTEDVMKRLQELLILGPPENGISANHLSSDDQLFLFESAGILIVSSQIEMEKKKQLFKDLLTPIVAKFELILERLTVEQDVERQVVLAECLGHAMAVTSRTSKAFSNQQTMKSTGSVQTYLDALRVFLRSLEQPHQQNIVASGVRQFLHRMVVCLEEEILPYIPMAAEYLLKDADLRSIQEFIPLVNQIITKFKKEIVPFLLRVFKPLVTAIFAALAAPIDENDQQACRDKQTLQRSYYLFIGAIITNGVTEVISNQDSRDVQEVLLSIIQGAVEFPDPVAQKTCFAILKKLVELWGGNNSLPGFDEFMYKNIVPACFLAPLKSTFDLTDAQTILALSESALCLRTMLELRGDELMRYLQSQYLPTMDVSPQLIDEYCRALRSDPKVFKNYLKVMLAIGAGLPLESIWQTLRLICTIWFLGVFSTCEILKVGLYIAYI